MLVCELFPLQPDARLPSPALTGIPAKSIQTDHPTGSKLCRQMSAQLPLHTSVSFPRPKAMNASLWAWRPSTEFRQECSLLPRTIANAKVQTLGLCVLRSHVCSEFAGLFFHLYSY